LIVAFVLVAWSVRSFERRRRPAVMAQVVAPDIMDNTEPAFPRDNVLLRQRNDMNSTQSPKNSSAAAPHAVPPESSVVYEEETRSEGVRVPRPKKSTAATERPATSAPRIRVGRTATAVVGLLAILVGIVTAIAAPFTAIAWPVPVFLLLVGVGAFGGLRYLALADRGLLGSARPGRSTSSATEGRNAESSRSRGETLSSEAPLTTAGSDPSSADVAALSPESAPARGQENQRPAESEARPEPTARSAEQDESTERAGQAPDVGGEGLVVRRPRNFLDDGGAQTGSAASREPEVQAPSDSASPIATVDEVPFVDDNGREGMDIEYLREQARRVAAGKPVAFTPVVSEWSPVEVPKPTYVDAPEVRRETPDPIEVPEEPKSSSSTLEEAARKGDSVLNLDDVLSRRRA
jgi:hypothetical protein